MKVAVLAVLCLVVAANATKKTYEGYKVFSTERLSEKQVSLLRKVEKTGHFDFWKGPLVGHKADIMASPEKVDMLTRILTKGHIAFSTLYEDVQSQIDLSLKRSSEPKKSADGKSPRYTLDWEQYHEYHIYEEFILELAATHDFASVVTIGQTHEGREMHMLQLNKAGPGAKNVFIEAGIHAREWISPAVASFLIKELIETHPEYLDSFNFHYIPSANPDGYVHSWEEDRMWRKNRVTHSGSTCYGTDLNRNWGYHWGETGVGAVPCSDTWPGTEAFSELEAQHIRDYFLALDPMPELALCLHSYGPLWLYPYGYDYIPDSEQPENNEEQIALAHAAVDALNAVHGQRFEAINSADLYPASGASDDWYKSLGVRFSYTPELRGPSFVLPPDQIQPSGEEMWAAFEVLLEKMLEE